MALQVAARQLASLQLRVSLSGQKGGLPKGLFFVVPARFLATCGGRRAASK